MNNNNNWMMQASQTGRLNINVTDGGLLELAGETYMLTCRDNPNTYQSPELHFKVVDSTVRVLNSRSLRFGRDDTTKPFGSPVLSLAATNSVFDVASGIYIGNDLTGLPTEGSYRAEFDSCVITAYQFCVYSDRTLNNALLNGTQIAFGRANSYIAAADFSIEATIANRKHLVFDTDSGYTITINGTIFSTPGSNSVNPMTVMGSGKVVCNYATLGNSSPYNGAAMVTNTATLAINPGMSATKGEITVATNATLEVAQSGTVALAGNLTLNDGAILSFNYTNRNEPVLDVTGKTVTFGNQSNVVVKISAADGKNAKSGNNVLTSGGAFTGVNVMLAPDAPKWARGVGVVNGEIVLDVKSLSTYIFVR